MVTRSVLIGSLVAYFISFNLTGAQTCVNNPIVDRRGDVSIGRGRQVIVPNARFNCNGRITNVTVSMDFMTGNDADNIPLFQVWHPTSLDFNMYNKIHEVQLPMGDCVNLGSGLGAYYFASLLLNRSSQIEFQLGDVIGYYQPSNPQRLIWSVSTSGYTSYSNTVTSPSTSIDINNVHNTEINRQPLIDIIFDIRCNNLSIPTNGNASCSSGRVGVGYEGDTCSFTCNTGYKLTGAGNDNRTCQSDGSWSGTDITCIRIQCNDLINGILQCPNENTPGFFGDICTFTCSSGYELQGPANGTCLANQSWSGGNPICEPLTCSNITMVTDNIMTSSSCNMTYQSQCTAAVSCDEGFTGDDVTYLCNVTSDPTMVDWVPIDGVDVMCERVQCFTPMNVILQCPNKVTNGFFEDTCVFSCNAGYELQGSNNGTCLANQSWSGGDPICVTLNCSDVTMVADNILTSSSCNMTYQSQCTVSCDEGFTGDDVTYVCNVTSNPTMVDWVPIGGVGVMCERVPCYGLVNGTLQCPNEATIGVFEDTCAFSCNAGYELQGSNNGTCLANQSWSGGDPICEPLNCSDVTMVADNIMTSSSCEMIYQSQCTVSCDEGFTGDDVTYLCNVTSDPTMVDWVPISGVGVMCEKVQCTSLSSPTNGSISCNSTDVSLYEDQCSFSCDPGYELTGSSSRQCLSNGSWSESDVTCNILHCDNFTDTIYVENSLLANDCGNAFGSVCRIECNTGYRAVVNDTFTCVSVNDTVEWRNGDNEEIFQCDIVTCEYLEEPPNGSINCSNNNQPLQYQDNCTFHCNDGYELQGSVTRQCEASGQWSGGRTQCNICHCPDITRLVPNSRSCDASYSSTCMVECEDGYMISGDSSQYICDLNGTEVVWMFNGSGATCSPVPCASLSDPENGNVTCPSNISAFQDTCTYYCSRGYQLEGSRRTSCNADGTWSNNPVTCNILKCTDPEVEIANSQSVGVCSVTYGSRCSLNCSSGFSASGNGEHVCDDVNDEGTSVKWRSIEGSFECVKATTVVQDEDESISTVPVIGGAVGGVVFLIIVIIVIVVVMLRIRKSKKRKGYLVNSKSSTNYRNNKASTFCVSNQLYEGSLPPPQPDYEEAEFSASHNYKYSVIEKALTTMHRNRLASAAPYEEPVSSTQPDLVQNFYEMPNATLDEMAESIEAEQQIYETPCEGEESVGPIYCTPPSNEEKIYEEFEGKRFCKIHHEELVTLEELGSGEFGIVTHGKWRPSPQKEIEVAIKMLNPTASDKDRLRFIKEAAIMCQFDHENVVKLYGVVTDAPRMIVLEYMSHGDLRSLLLKLQSLEIHLQLPLVLLKFCREIAAGMAYLSGKHFIHRDLAARNILVAETTTCKIADFGMSCDLIDESYYVTSGGKVPVKWTAPEALHYRKYSLYSDVWSYGCVMYEIWSLGHKPFEALANDETFVKIESGYRLPPPPGCPRTIYRTMIKCWNPDPRSRPQFGQLVNVLAGKSGYLLGWSDEEKRDCSKEAVTLGAPLEAANDLYYDLQLTFMHTQ